MSEKDWIRFYASHDSQWRQKADKILNTDWARAVLEEEKK